MEHVEWLQVVSNLGIGGLLFIMWWLERKSRQEMEAKCVESHEAIISVKGDRECLVKVVQDNTRALSELTSTLNGFRADLDDRPCLVEYSKKGATR